MMFTQRRRIKTSFPKEGHVRATFMQRLRGISIFATQSRRGSFLILVVGTLALLAVVAVVYVLIGRSDAQTSAATLKSSTRKEVPEQMKEYILNILSDDLFDVVYLGERGKTGADRKYRRETWDYPSSAYKTRLPAGPRDLYEDVTVGGSNTAARFTPTGNRTGTDPWLASSEPTLLNFDGSDPAENDPTQFWRDKLDWAQISDIAPDGAFVNLFNLRGLTKNGKNKPNFDATPWEMRGLIVNSQSAGAPLTLFGPQVDRTRSSTLDYGGNATSMDQDNARPAAYASRQRAAFFAKADPNYAPDDPNYLLYQYADADGDGILDSRWFEMTEARVGNNNGRGPTTEFIKNDDRFRYFFAARIVDLSGRVNVNTAADAMRAPDFVDPAGLYPSAIDLRRLLTLQDEYSDTDTAFGYEASRQPRVGGSLYQTPADYTNYNSRDSFDVGQRAYDALRMTLDTGVLPGPGYDGLATLDGGSGTSSEIARDFNSDYFVNRKPLLPSAYYEIFAGYGNQGGSGTASSVIGRSFGLDSLFELLTYNGINDGEHQSPLEAVLGGRSNIALGYNEGLADRSAYSPLRDTRPTSLERGNHFSRIKNTIIFNKSAKAWAYTDVRHDLTTVSGARPLTPRILDSSDVKKKNLSFSQADVRVNVDDLLTDVNTTSQEKAQKLFDIYADALLPYSYIPLHWRPSVHPALTDTLYYGHRGPELAIRAAAHAAINFIDAYDLAGPANPTTDGPTIRTVVIDGSSSFRTTNLDNNGRDRKYPWKLLDLDARFQGSGDTRLWDGTAAGGAPTTQAVNIFGIEAQPFITEAASFIMYTDTPSTAGNPGDQDFPLGGNNIGFLPSINGDPADSNPDCLFEVLAFQIHNPFDQTITLKSASSTGTDPGQYYIAYGGHYYKIEDADATGNAIQIDPRKSRTFYVLSGSVGDINSRIDNALEGPGADIQAWIDTQFGGGLAAPIRLAEFDPQNGNPIPPSGSYQSLQGSAAENAVVKLWRIEKPQLDLENGGFAINSVNEDASTNDITNDTLVDRMRDPEAGTPTLNRQLDPSPDQTGAVTNAQSGGEPNAGDPPPSPDNEGLTITRWGRLARREDPNAGNIPLGGLPAYCIEAKTQTIVGSKNTIGNDGSTPTSPLDIGDFSIGTEAGQTLQAVLDQQTATQLVDTIDMDPQDKSTGNTIGANLDNVPFDGDANNPPLYVQTHINNQEFKIDTGGGGGGNGVSVLRLADLLLPLGIGPYQVPELPDEDQQWTTLSEALAFALRYDNDAPGRAYVGAFDPAKPQAPLLDTAHLQYDQFVPFLDVGADGQFDAGTDTRWGLGVPMAASIFDFLTTMPREFGSLYRPTPGVININTAPREVARSMPLLSPPENLDPGGNPLWWWTGDGVHTWRSDIASTLIAYRDRIALHVRNINGNQPLTQLDFRDSNDGTVNNDAPGVNRLDNGRSFATAVDAIREEPGFRSLAEVAILRDLNHPGSDNLSYSSPHDIDRLGFDNKNLDRPGVYSYGIIDDNNKMVSDGINDNYAERLAITNAVLSSASVRSDVFAVWFIVHGYQESDVKDLGPNDPMVPTIARRFVMVVDRSNVIKPGDKPKVLLFKEVPL